MKSRILKRPMFKMGGSTDGILSGLDTPRLDASRQGYSRGADVRKRVETIRGIYDDILPAQDRRGMPGSVSNFLTGFGLNLLGQPGGRNIFQTAAKAAQTPYQQFVSARSKEQAEERALTQAIIGDAIEQESDEEIARLKAQEGKTYEFEKKLGAYEGFQKTISSNIKKINSIDNEIKQKQEELATIQSGEKGEIDTVKVDFINKEIETPANPITKPKKELPVEKKPFQEFINMHLIPSFTEEINQRGLEINNINLTNTNRPIAGDKCWVINCEIKDTCNFWLSFEKDDISSLKSISLSKPNQQPSIIESFLIDEKRITLKLIISRVLQRLNGQKLIGVN